MLKTAISKFATMALTCVAAFAALASQTPPGSGAITLAPDSAIFAKLTSNLDLAQSKAGDQLTAEITNDVKVGNQVVIKKGSALMGHITTVESPKGSQTETIIGIVTDSVSSKKGPSAAIVLLIRAIAPAPPEDQPSTISEGRGMPGATDNAVVPGRVSAGGTASGRLIASSTGVTGFPNIHLGSSKNTNGTAFTVISLSPGDAKLKKGTQLLLKAPPL